MYICDLRITFKHQNKYLQIILTFGPTRKRTRDLK